jgi:hypothetical protein
MDFNECMKILSERQAVSAEGSCCCSNRPATEEEGAAGTQKSDFSDASVMDLISIFQQMQEERVMVLPLIYHTTSTSNDICDAFTHFRLILNTMQL